MKYNEKMKKQIDEYLDLLIEFERKVQHNRFVEVKFHEEIQENVIFENIKYKFEHDILVTVLKLKEQGLDNKKINEELKPLLKGMDVKLKELFIKSQSFRLIYKNIEDLGEENIEAFSKHYYDFIKDKYIMLKRPAEQKLIEDYNSIRMAFLSFDPEMISLINDFQYTCNLEEDKGNDFDKFIELKIKALKEQMVEIEKYDENFKNLEEDLKDDMSIANHESKIRDENYKIKTENKALQQEVEKFANGEIDYAWFDKSKEQ